jgi:CRP-like cAMP-binding protein
METLLAIMIGFGYVSDELKMYLQQHLKVVSLPKKHVLLEAGKISNKMYFVESGLLRGYYLKDGKEVTAWIMPEHEFVISILSFYRQTPSYEYIELLEDSTLWAMSYEKLKKAYKLFPEFNYIGRGLTERYYVMSEYRSYYLRMHTAEERLKLLLADFPTILARVKHKYVASLLGLSPETLSRILANKL